MRDEDRRRYEAHATSRIFRRRLDEAYIALQECRGKRVVVSTSWGKDSCVCVHLAQAVLGPGVECVHLRSPYELPGGEHVEAWFRERGALLTDVPTRLDLAGYIDWLQQLGGLGFERENISHGKKRKIDALHSWYEERGIEARISGVRADESKGRKVNFKSRGLTYQLRSGVWSCNPIAWWSTPDVWAYLVTRGVPWHRLYDCETHGFTRETNRNAGWLTVRDPERADWLRVHFPEQWRVLAREFPRVRLV